MPTGNPVHQKLDSKLAQFTLLHVHGRKFRLKETGYINSVMADNRYILRNVDATLPECTNNPKRYIICSADQSIRQTLFPY